MTARPPASGPGADTLGPDDVVRAVTLDGPAGSGKSTVARAVARRLALSYVDTGATYRAATLAVLRAQVPLDDVDRVREVALAARIALDTDPEAPRVLLDDEDVTAEVRGPEVTAAVSAVSALPEVRARLVQIQRAAMAVGAVAEGRDVGSAVAPSALVKVFLDADPAVRAARRAGDGDAGVRSAGPDLVSSVAADLARRDALDSGRAASPTRAAADAVHLDSSALSVEQVVAAVLALATAAGLATAP